MTGKNRFDFLDEVAAEEPQASSLPTPTSPGQQDRPYLYQQHPRTEPLAPLGNRVRLPAKHALEDYVRDLKRAGHPATEARVLEALMLLVQEDVEVKRKLDAYLTGSLA